MLLLHTLMLSATIATLIKIVRAAVARHMRRFFAKSAMALSMLNGRHTCHVTPRTLPRTRFDIRQHEQAIRTLYQAKWHADDASRCFMLRLLIV